MELPSNTTQHQPRPLSPGRSRRTDAETSRAPPAFAGFKERSRFEKSKEISRTLDLETFIANTPSLITGRRPDETFDGAHCIGRTHSNRRAAKSILILTAVVFSIIIFTCAMMAMVVSLSQSQARLAERVFSLEQRLAELGDVPVDCLDRARSAKRTENRNNKFAFLMTKTARKGVTNKDGIQTARNVASDVSHTVTKSADDDSTEAWLTYGNFDSRQEFKEISSLDTSASEIHPVAKIKAAEANKMTMKKKTTAAAPSRIDNGRHFAAHNVTFAIIPPSGERMPDISRVGSRVKRSARRRERARDRERDREREREETGGEALPRGNSSEVIRGVHYQANLNRTTTIGVGEAGWVPHWTLSSSMGYSGQANQLKQEFRLSPRGNVTVRTAGVYYIYSQMMYYDEHEYIGHSIVVNGVEAFTCIAPIAQQTNKYKTCFIGGLVYVPARAKVGIKMLYTPRQVCLFEDTSYFGMFRIT